MSMEDLGEDIMFVAYLSLVVAGLNIIFGMFFYPYGLIGFAFSVVDLILFFIAKNTKDVYEARDYDNARDRMKIITILGFITGVIIVGIYAYRIYQNLDSIITRRYLVKTHPGEVYAPPQFPRRKN